MPDSSKIALLTTVANFDLYSKTAPLFPQGIRLFVIDGRNGMHGIHSIRYMMRKLKSEKIDWLIMADEDVIIKDSAAVLDIITYMEQHRFTISGIRDGGVIKHRFQNPFAVNTFFSIINIKEIFEVYDEKTMLSNQYMEDGEFDDDLGGLEGPYDTRSLFEPYYCFYFWLRRMGKKILFLDAAMLDDGLTNSLIFKGKTFGYHTWYARSYGQNKKHTDRIDKVLQNVGSSGINQREVNPVVFKDKSFYLVQSLKRLMRRVLLRLK